MPDGRREGTRHGRARGPRGKQLAARVARRDRARPRRRGRSDEILTALAGAPPGPEADAGRAEDLSDGMVRTAHAFGMRLAVGNAGGAYFAIEATCPHANGPLDLGELHGTTLTCPIHGFDFDVRTGACITDPRCGVKALPVELRGGHVWVLRPR